MGGMFSKPKAPPPPPVVEPTPMPDPELTGGAKKDEYARIRARSGRDSTILTDTGNKLGG